MTAAPSIFSFYHLRVNVLARQALVFLMEWLSTGNLGNDEDL